MKKNALKVLSLFAGAGGMDLGFKNAGYEIIWANDFDADSVKTYKRNLGDHIVLGDIEKIKTNNMLTIKIKTNKRIQMVMAIRCHLLSCHQPDTPFNLILGLIKMISYRMVIQPQKRTNH